MSRRAAAPLPIPGLLPLPLLLLLILVPAPGSAQVLRPSPSVDCRGMAPAASTVRGRLLPDPGIQADGWFVALHRGDERLCAARSDASGAFELRGLEPGEYRLLLGPEGVRRTVVPLAVQPGAVLNLHIPLQAEDRVADCLPVPACATVLTRATSRELDGTEEERLLLLSYRLGLVIAGEGWRRERDWVPCVDEPESFVTLLREVFPPVVHASECELVLDPLPANDIRAAMRWGEWTHPASGLRARLILPGRPQMTSDTTANARPTYTEGRHNAGGFVCELERVDEHWVPRTCVRRFSH